MSVLPEQKSVAIVDGGYLGSELAREIASAMPAKDVTLLSGDDAFFPALPRKDNR